MDCIKCPIYLTYNSRCGPVSRHLTTERRKTGDCARLPYSIPMADIIPSSDINNIIEWIVENTVGYWATARDIVESGDKGQSIHPQTFIRFELNEDAVLFKLTFLEG